MTLLGWVKIINCNKTNRVDTPSKKFIQVLCWWNMPTKTLTTKTAKHETSWSKMNPFSNHSAECMDFAWGTCHAAQEEETHQPQQYISRCHENILLSMDWFKGQMTGNQGFYHQIQGFPLKFPIIQFYDSWQMSPLSIDMLLHGSRFQLQFCLERLTEPSCLHGRALPLYEATPVISMVSIWVAQDVAEKKGASLPMILKRIRCCPCTGKTPLRQHWDLHSKTFKNYLHLKNVSEYK